jgi:hypothetical protein
MIIGAYFISDYCKLFYCRPSVVILLVAINGYPNGGYFNGGY